MSRTAWLPNLEINQMQYKIIFHHHHYSIPGCPRFIARSSNIKNQLIGKDVGTPCSFICYQNSFKVNKSNQIGIHFINWICHITMRLPLARLPFIPWFSFGQPESLASRHHRRFGRLSTQVLSKLGIINLCTYKQTKVIIEVALLLKMLTSSQST